jgi:4-amino-4-deoxy-L-arabinose transferase-like glycosyltransferase
VLFKTQNAIAASTLVLSVHPKVILTEFPTAVLMVLLCLWMGSWLKHSDRQGDLFWVGAVLGIGIMLRSNMLLLLPIIFLMIVVVPHLTWRKKGMAFFWVFLAFWITISPWMWRSYRVANQPFFFLPRFKDVIGQRYLTEPLPHNPGMARARLSSVADEKYLAGNQLQEGASPFWFVPNHFLHNLVTSVLILPTSSILDDLKHTVQTMPYWDRGGALWQGELSSGATVFLVLDLGIIALGLAWAWRRSHWAGLVPVVFFLTYHMANGLARTSGGRYLVPVDWVVLFYVAAGLSACLLRGLRWLGFPIVASKLPRLSSNVNIRTGLLGMLPFFLLVAGITMVDQGIPPRYPEMTAQDVAGMLIEQQWLNSSSVTADDLQEFLGQPDALLLFGRGLYPRFYPAGEGEFSAGKDAFEVKNFPRMSFSWLGPQGQLGVVLPTSKPVVFPDAVDVVVVGCQHPREGYLFPYLDAVLVVVIPSENTSMVYVRDPSAPLACPLPDPVCDNNHNCE